MKLKVLLEKLETREIVGSVDVEVNTVHGDSRRLRKGDAFVALRGDKVDGHDFVDEAVGAGVSVIVCEEIVGTFPSVTQVRVSDCRVALAHLAAKIHGFPSEALKLIGITGTNGKTTTSYLIAAILEAAHLSTGVIGTLAYKIGNRELPAHNTTPPADELQEMFAQVLHGGGKAVVMEVSSHSLVQHRVDEVAWDAGVFTNLTQDHLDYHKTMQAYCDAKKILFQRLGAGKKKASAILNADDAKVDEFRKALKADVLVKTYGLSHSADIWAESVEQSINGCRFILRTKDSKTPISTTLCGAHNVSNCLAAAATALSLGFDVDVIKKGLESVKNVPGRLERVGDALFSVFVDYAHTDDALKNVLKTLRPLAKGRLITVFGCGGNRDALKRPLMGRVASEMSDINIITTDNPRYEEPSAIADQIAAGFGVRKNFEIVLDRREAIRAAIKVAKSGDVVLLAGKGHETYQDICGTRSAFDDRKVASEALEKMSSQRRSE
jgi:UDP-N-acetylmuramoyl-L-alanyl-D-glutamate--2,6-diaminopimelate ligase